MGGVYFAAESGLLDFVTISSWLADSASINISQYRDKASPADKLKLSVAFISQPSLAYWILLLLALGWPTRRQSIFHNIVTRRVRLINSNYRWRLLAETWPAKGGDTRRGSTEENATENDGLLPLFLFLPGITELNIVVHLITEWLYETIPENIFNKCP